MLLRSYANKAVCWLRLDVLLPGAEKFSEREKPGTSLVLYTRKMLLWGLCLLLSDVAIAALWDSVRLTGVWETPGIRLEFVDCVKYIYGLLQLAVVTSPLLYPPHSSPISLNPYLNWHLHFYIWISSFDIPYAARQQRW